VFIPSK